ncbi:MAG: arsenate reductase family protein [Opitutales bacterium]|nr:arsenate reductase family protein [Opitutales bacterium]
MKKYLFLEYPKCTTCRRAKEFLKSCGADFEDRHIVENRPDAEELRRWILRSGVPVKKFFNTSGLRYKALALKDKLPEMSDEEQIALLATDGMLVKRPLLVSENSVLVGFKQPEWETELKK